MLVQALKFIGPAASWRLRTGLQPVLLPLALAVGTVVTTVGTAVFTVGTVGTPDTEEGITVPPLCLLSLQSLQQTQLSLQRSLQSLHARASKTALRAVTEETTPLAGAWA